MSASLQFRAGSQQPANSGKSYGSNNVTGLPVWARLAIGIAAMLAVSWTAMIVLTYVERRDATIEQAHDFAESTNQMINATLTGMMITGVSKDRAVFLDQVRESNNIKKLRVVRTGTTVTQYGAGNGSEGSHTDEETAAMTSGKPLFKLNEKEGYLSATFPILNWRNYLGKDCMSCHQGAENSVLGAISMHVSLTKAQAQLNEFAWRITLIAFALSLPLLGGVYYFVRTK